MLGRHVLQSTECARDGVLRVGRSIYILPTPWVWRSTMIDVFRVDRNIPTVRSDMLLLLISTQWFAHVKSIFTFFGCRGIIAVVVDHPSVYGVPEQSLARAESRSHHKRAFA